MANRSPVTIYLAIVLIAKRHLYDDVHCQVNLVQLNLCPSGFKYAPSDLPSPHRLITALMDLEIAPETSQMVIEMMEPEFQLEPEIWSEPECHGYLQ